MDLAGLHELVRQMEWADALVWAAALPSPEAAGDHKLRGTLFHIHMVQRAFLSVWKSGQLTRAPEEAPELTTTLEAARDFYAELTPFLSALGVDELGRPVVLPWARRFGAAHATPTLADTIIQVTMHSAYHRGQANARLRELGVEPPLTDYIAWVWFGRPEPQWPAL